ncbi:hypothetical protein BC937DRAFT_88083 [Endogone sp. FLAS-F59071]|nr:hypothetical protein BC937DRAFT_88083 [Endogone sp. FLAS-F59071]|eukprot:RUS18999.1 hypothetical protein BC937DRAFT_88083 [Endogone sp. FLAS-F59071]
MDIPNANTPYIMNPWPIPDESVHWFDLQQESFINESQASRDSIPPRGAVAEPNPESAHAHPGPLGHDADSRDAHSSMGSMEIDQSFGEHGAQESALDVQKKINLLLYQSSNALNNNSQRPFENEANAIEDSLSAHSDSADLNRGGTRVHPGRSGRDADGRDTQLSMGSMETDQPYNEFNTQQLALGNPILTGLTPNQPLDVPDIFQLPGILANEAQTIQDSVCLQGDGINPNDYGALAQLSRSGCNNGDYDAQCSADNLVPYQANHTFRVELSTSKFHGGPHRTRVACSRCHNQKHKCDGRAPCQRCRKAETKCIYPDELVREVSILGQGIQVLDLEIKKFSKQKQVTNFDECEQTVSYSNNEKDENAKAKLILTKNGIQLKVSNYRQLYELLESITICTGIHRGPAHRKPFRHKKFFFNVDIFLRDTWSFPTIEDHLLQLILEKTTKCECLRLDTHALRVFMINWEKLQESTYFATMCYAIAAANAAHVIECHIDITELDLNFDRNITLCQLKDLSVLAADQYFHKADGLLKDLIFGDDSESADGAAAIALFAMGRYQKLKSKDSASNIYYDMAIRVAMQLNYHKAKLGRGTLMEYALWYFLQHEYDDESTVVVYVKLIESRLIFWSEPPKLHKSTILYHVSIWGQPVHIGRVTVIMPR